MISTVVDLPAPFGPRKAKTSPFLTVERDAVDRQQISVTLRQVLDFDGVFSRGSPWLAILPLQGTGINLR